MQDIDLTVRPQSRDELTAWYTAALEDQARSGQSMADYAEDLGVAPATLYQWKRRSRRPIPDVIRGLDRVASRGLGDWPGERWA
jgi:transcriptional regulator with XRE-family HTH domain